MSGKYEVIYYAFDRCSETTHRLTVSDLERHKKLLEDVFGFTHIYQGTSSDGKVAASAGVKTEGIDYAFLRAPVGDSTMAIELVRFKEAVADGGVVEKMSDLGCVHLALLVEDGKEALEKLQAAGLKLLGDPATMTEEPAVGAITACFRDWDGHTYELIQMPEGMAPP